MPTKIKDPNSAAFQLKIELDYSEPLIWRRVLVDTNSTLLQLHYVIQAVMNWDGDHLWEFALGVRKRSYREQVDVRADESLDFRLGDLWRRAGQKIQYIYDFGDNWRHTIRVEKKLPRTPDMKLPACIEAEMASPLEGFTGLGGYYRFLEALQDSEHPDHEEYMEYWGEYDPNKVDFDKINKRLKRMQK